MGFHVLCQYYNSYLIILPILLDTMFNKACIRNVTIFMICIRNVRCTNRVVYKTSGTLLWWDVMSCVCKLWWDGMSSPLSVYWDGMGCLVLSVYCERMGCHALSVYWDGMGCHALYLYCDGMGCPFLSVYWQGHCGMSCPLSYTVMGWDVMSCVYSMKFQFTALPKVIGTIYSKFGSLL